MLKIASPFFLAQRALSKAIRKHARCCPGRLLDVGCGTQPYREFFHSNEYWGIEVLAQGQHGSRKLADAYFDGSRIPFADQSFDAVFCSQVLEHVFQPDDFLKELARVTKPDGRLLLTVPFVWDEHEQPYDYGRYSSFGLKALLARHGFEVAEHVKTLSDASIITQLSLTYLYKISSRLPRPLHRLCMAAMAIPLNILGLILAASAPRNADFYLDNVVLCNLVPTQVETQ
ncbi:MAG TPA: methyltransferase domain-containing protein [Fontimonas sp.]